MHIIQLIKGKMMNNPMKKINSMPRFLFGTFALIFSVFGFLIGESAISVLIFGVMGIGSITDSIFVKKGYLKRVYDPGTWFSLLFLGIGLAYIYIFQPVYTKDPFFYVFSILLVFLIGLAVYESRKMKKYQKTVGPYENAIETNPEDAAAWNNKGTVVAEFNAFQEAMDCFDKVLKINPHDAAALHNKGVVLEKQGKRQEAVKYYDSALKMDSGFNSAKKEGKIILES